MMNSYMPSSSRKTSSSASSAALSTTKGVQKLYSKIRHKIEDIPPRITAKLNKTTKLNGINPVQQATKPVAAPRTKRSQPQNSMPRIEQPKRKQSSLSSSLSSSSLSDSSPRSRPPRAPTYENIRISSDPNGTCVDSDEECRLSMNTSTISLEDEIFEELEKVAHDEAKLNAVLKNFDKILADFNATNQTIMKMNREPKSIPVDLMHTDRGGPTSEKKSVEVKCEKSPHKPLQKSKTCSIIESRCILKKSISEPNGSCEDRNMESITNNLQHYSAFQVTKSLWNLQDFEAFAKSGKKFEYKLPSLSCIDTPEKIESKKSVSSTPSPSKTETQIETPRLRSNLPRAKSVWELSSLSPHTPGQHPVCIRTSSGSKIPVKKFNSHKLSANGRSNSFSNEATGTVTKILIKSDHTKSTPAIQQKRLTPVRSSTPCVNRIVRNLNEMSNSSAATKSSSVNKRRTISSASSTPHSLHKVGITSKALTNSAVSSNSLVASNATSPVSTSSSSLSSTAITTAKLTIKSSRSELTLNKLKATSMISIATPKKSTPNNKFAPNGLKKQQSDVLLNKCLEKGHAILRKVEAFGSVTKLEVSPSPSNFGSVSKTPNRRDIILAPTHTPTKLKRYASKDDIVPSVTKTKLLSTNSAPLSLSRPEKATEVPLRETKVNRLQNYRLLVVDKKHTNSTSNNASTECRTSNFAKLSSSDAVDGIVSQQLASMNSIQEIKLSTKDSSSSSVQPVVMYAQEATVKYPRLESCKIIAPLLVQPDKNHAELLVNVKSPLRVHQDSIVSEKEEYQSDCSDDSGHISNENEDIIPTNTYTPARLTNGGSQPPHKTQKSTKISELLEKFEPLTPKIMPSLTTSPCKGVSKTSTSSLQQQTPSDDILEEATPKKNCTSIKIAEIRPVNGVKSSLEIYPTYSSEVLFRSGVLSQLEAKRDELLSDRIVQLQAYCRGYLARRRVAQRRVQELAVRCIQRNVRAFLAVRDWPWWRLLVRVTPLLNVHRTEEQLKIANDELQMLRAKLEKIENDRNALKTENDKLEAKLSEMTVDLTEERSAANITSERLEAETAERLKLEKELHEQQTKVKNLQETSEKLEMELICAKSDLNGISEDEDPDNDEGGGVYKLKYERVARELEFTKRRLQTQHEHDLEQLVGLKKQLEKKLSDAYEEVEEQRQVVGQWKRKAQKMTNEMNDLRMLLEEQNSRNNLLEKKQRKFDAECQSLQDAARQERQAKDRLAREKDVLIAEKFTLEQNLADARLELELKEEKLSALQRDIEEMTFGGGTEEEVAQLRRSKNDMERRLKEQEEELDDMAGQVQLLEQAKLRLEMTLETVRKEARREAQQRDEELEEARGSAYKKLKAMECQLESEHEERTLLLREKHELERRLQAMEEQDRCDRATEEAANQKLRRDIRKYKALLKDAHAQLERLKADSPNKALIRQLRNQLEDAESSRIIAMKARQSTEAELADVQASLEDAQRARSEAEDKAAAAQRDRVELQTQIEENEEEMSELMKKYSATVKQLNNEQSALSEYEIRISELEAERNSLSEQVAELQTRLENIENMTDPSAAVQSKRLELRAKELESRLELEQATRARLEIQSNRHKDAVEKLQNDISQTKLRELQAQDALKKAQKNLRELREEFHMVSNREQECTTRRKDLEKKLEAAEAEAASLRSDLRLALQRIADLQQAMEEGDEDVTESDESDSTDDSISDIEQRLRLIQAKRPSSSTPTAPLKETNGLSDTSLVIKEKTNENSPRITISSPGSGAKTFGKSGEALKNGDTSFA